MTENVSAGQKTAAYVMLWSVVFIWGTAPLICNYIYEYFSPTVMQFMIFAISTVSLVILDFKHLKELNRSYFAVAVPTGACNLFASLLQKIGLLYTTPANYAFLENLSCVVVLFILWGVTRKKPSKLNVLTTILCIIGAFILSGVKINAGMAISKGDALCALSGLLYGVNIAVTGINSKKFRPSLYILVQLATGAVISFFNMILLNSIEVNGAPIAEIKYEFLLLPILAVVFSAVVSNVLCWILRTKAMQSINTVIVSVISPTSAIVTAVLSVLIGTDRLTSNLVIGGTIGFLAAILSAFDDTKLPRRKQQ